MSAEDAVPQAVSGDQWIRARALESAIEVAGGHTVDDNWVLWRAQHYEDYIKTGRVPRR